MSKTRLDEFLPFHRPFLGEEEIAEVVDTLRSGWLTMGPKTFKFEEKFAALVGSDHAVAVSSCTAALHLEGADTASVETEVRGHRLRRDFWHVGTFFRSPQRGV